MGRWFLLTVICLAIIGGLMTFNVSLSWVGQLPGDFSIMWEGITIFIPLTTSILFSFALLILLSVFVK